MPSGRRREPLPRRIPRAPSRTPSPPSATATRSSSPPGAAVDASSTNPEPTAMVMEGLPGVGGRFGYVSVLAFSGGGAPPRWPPLYHRLIEGIDTLGVCGWIVDLRDNPGGNMWPMVAGLGPILGEGVLGFFVDPDSVVDTWTYADGASALDGAGAGESGFPLRAHRSRSPRWRCSPTSSPPARARRPSSPSRDVPRPGALASGRTGSPPPTAASPSATARSSFSPSQHGGPHRPALRGPVHRRRADRGGPEPRSRDRQSTPARLAWLGGRPACVPLGSRHGRRATALPPTRSLAPVA